jgi:uncharacterized protein
MTFASFALHNTKQYARRMHNSQFEKVQLHSIDPRTRYFWAFWSFILGLLPLFALIPLAISVHLPWLMLPYPLLIAWLAWRYANAAMARFGYALLEDGLWLEQGVYWRKAVFVPRVRVQHTEVGHGPLDRKMGLASLVVHTAGMRVQHLKIPGLSEASAHQLRDALLQRTQPADTSA